MTLFRSLAAALLLMFVAATPAHAQAQETKVGDWSIFSNENNCSALATFGQGTTVYVSYSRADDRASLMFMDNKVFAGAKDGAPFEAQLAFVAGESLDDKWMTLPIVGVVLEGGSTGVLIRAPGDALLKSMSAAQIFGLLRGTEAVISVKTGDITPVVSALRACAAKLK